MRSINTGVAVIVGVVIGVLPLCARAGVLAYWDFDPSKNGIADASGNGNWLVNNGVTFSNGAAVFNGSHTDFRTASGLDLRTNIALTVEAFVKTSVTTGDRLLLEHASYGGWYDASGRFAFYLSASKGYSVYRGSAGYGVDETTNTVTDGQWHHVAMVIDTNATGTATVELYLDGVKQKEGTSGTPAGYPLRNEVFHIGSRLGSSYKFTGEMDDVRISSGALTPEQFLQARTALVTPPKANLIAYWPFNPGSELTDASSNGNTLSNTGVTFINGAAVFNGGHTVFSTAANLNLTTHSNITIEAFVRDGGGATDLRFLFEHSPDWNGNAGAVTAYCEASGAVNAGYRNTSNFTYDRSGANPLVAGRWQHVALTVNLLTNGHAVAELYIGGVKAYDTGVGAGISSLRNDILYIGSRGNSSFKLVGQLDDVRISDRVLAPWEFMKTRSVPPPASVAYWPYNPGNPLDDVTGNGNVLTNAGVSFAGGAAIFDGAQSAFNTLNSLDLSGYPALTIEMFARSSSSGARMLCEQTANYNNALGAFMLILGDTAGAGGVTGSCRFQDGYRNEKTPSGTLTGTTWHHLALVLDTQTNKANRLQLYLDGVRQTKDGAYDGELFAPFRNDTLFIGSRGNSSLKFIGEIDDLRISGRALAPAEFLSQRSLLRGTMISVF